MALAPFESDAGSCSTFLRTGEIFCIRRENVVFGSPGQEAIIFLQDAGTAQRKQILWKKVVVKEPLALSCLEELCYNWPNPQLLVQESFFQFRKMDALQLSQWKILLYSIRRGGATSADRRGMRFEEFMRQGRRSNVAIFPSSLPPVLCSSRLFQCLIAVSQYGAHGGAQKRREQSLLLTLLLKNSSEAGELSSPVKTTNGTGTGSG